VSNAGRNALSHLQLLVNRDVLETHGHGIFRQARIPGNLRNQQQHTDRKYCAAGSSVAASETANAGPPTIHRVRLL